MEYNKDILDTGIEVLCKLKGSSKQIIFIQEYIFFLKNKYNNII